MIRGLVSVIVVLATSGCPLLDDSPYYRACHRDDECGGTLYQCDTSRSICVRRDHLGRDAANGDGAVSADAATADAAVDGNGGYVFSDDDPVEFGQGTPQDIVVTDGGLRLASGSLSGVFTSRPLAPPGTGRGVSIGWLPAAPYAKPLPDHTRDDSEQRAYAQDGADLTGLIFLLHLGGDTGAALFSGAQADDTSGRQHPVRLVDNDPSGNSLHVDGKVGGADYLKYEDYFVIEDADASPDFAFDTLTFTWAAWVKIESCAVNQDNAIAIGGEVPHIWLGASCPSGEAVWQVSDDVNVDAAAISSFSVVDNRWHLLVGVKLVAPPSIVLYVDGLHADSVTGSWSHFGNFTKNIFLGNFPIGSPPLWDYQSQLMIDEVAIWRRGLAAGEVAALYRRAVSNLLLQVRSCNDISCSTAGNFVGPTGASELYFHEGVNVTPPAAVPLDFELIGPAFQYQVALERDDDTVEPLLRSVTLTAESR